MKKLLILLLFMPLCMACKKEPIGEPLVQLHFINFVDTSGKNLFESDKIPTSEFYYRSGDFIETWEEILAEKKYHSTSITESISHGYTYADTLTSMLNNDNLLLESWQGNLERERVISINGVKHMFRYSLKDGFYQNGKKLEYTTDAIDEYHLYLHHVVLEEY